jgi:hypothetical protein
MSVVRIPKPKLDQRIVDNIELSESPVSSVELAEELDASVVLIQEALARLLRLGEIRVGSKNLANYGRVPAYEK